METVSFLCALTLSLLGCPKPEATAESPRVEQLKLQFSQADTTLASYLAILAAPTTSRAERRRVICQDFPRVYQQQYQPLALKLNTDPEPMLQAMQSYQIDDKIKCR